VDILGFLARVRGVVVKVLVVGKRIGVKRGAAVVLGRLRRAFVASLVTIGVGLMV